MASLVGTTLEPFLNSFQECGFRHDVETFVKSRAPLFAATCPDGSQPLVWTEAHHAYRALFDAQLDLALEYHADRALEREEFLAYCNQLAAESKRAAHGDVELSGTGGARAADFDYFLEAMTASEDYNHFLRIMFRAAAEAGHGGTAAEAHEQEIEVMVPEGVGPGEVLAVDYLGCRYELPIPQDCEPGACFRAKVQAPALVV